MTDHALAALLVFAPLAAGSWKLEVLPLLVALATVAWVALAVDLSQRRSSLRVGLLPLGLLALAGWTTLQALPLAAGTLETLSPKAGALRAFVGGASGPVSYEAGATLREVTKLLVYALVAQVARDRCRVHGVRSTIAVPLVVGGLLAAGVAVLHRLLGIERLFGLVDTITSPREMLTTFANPNHAAGFLVLTCTTALGLGLAAKDAARRALFLSSAVVLGGLGVVTASKGGLVALIASLALFLPLWSRRRATRDSHRPSWPPVVVTAALLAAGGLTMLWIEDLATQLAGLSAARELGVMEKLAAIRDAVPLIRDHPWTGIGRGAYVSVYTLYKTSTLQLTFAFPENVLTQLVSEWGVVVGSAALFGLVYAVLGRLWVTRHTAALALMCGAAGVLIQNLVDFSLELPGIAIPITAILGGVAAHWRGARHVRAEGPWFVVLSAALPILTGLACLSAFLLGDLARDLGQLERRVERAKQGQPVPQTPPTADIVRRHPASALVSAQAAYLAELSDPPALDKAIRWANRTLYLAPTYAGGHLVAGRLLVRAGHRNQGFGELRHTLRLARSDHLPTYLDHVVDLARGPEEVARALPRRDPILDLISERYLSRTAHHLVRKDRKDWARALMNAEVDPSQVPQQDLLVVAIAADLAGATETATKTAERLATTEGAGPEELITAARIAFRNGRPDWARELLQRVPASHASADLLALRARLEISSKEFEAAQETLRELKVRTKPSAADEERVAQLELELHLTAGDLAAARDTLDRALAHRPGRTRLRLARARLLLKLRKHALARVDLEYVLALTPQHKGAQRLLRRLEREADER